MKERESIGPRIAIEVASRNVKCDNQGMKRFEVIEGEVYEISVFGYSRYDLGYKVLEFFYYHSSPNDVEILDSKLELITSISNLDEP